MLADATQPSSIELLSLIGQWFNNFASQPIELLPFGDILPLTGFTIVHSLRIAYLYHSLLSSQGVKVGRRKQDVSFLQAGLVCSTLVMSGTTMAAILQGKPSNLFSEGSGELVAAYMLASFAMKWLHPILNQLPQLPLKLICFFIDGFATTFGTLSLGLIPTLQDSTKLSSTGEPLILPMFLIPLLCGSGASLLVPFFGLFQPRFSFSHPGFLSENLSVDFWGPWLISLCYGTIVDGRGVFGSVRKVLQSGFASFGSKPIELKEPVLKSWMRPDEAHVLCSLILSVTYIVNEFGPQIFKRITTPSSSKKLKKSVKTQHNNEIANAILATGFQSPAIKLNNRKEKK